jgi:hypothetical protein
MHRYRVEDPAFIPHCVFLGADESRFSLSFNFFYHYCVCVCILFDFSLRLDAAAAVFFFALLINNIQVE